MDEARFAAQALHREAQARAAERAEAERISLRLSQETAARTARLQREQMAQWKNDAQRGR